MSEEQKQISRLRQQYQTESGAHINSGISGLLYGELQKTAKSSTQWPTEAKQELAGLAKEIIEHLGIKSNKKAKELLKSLSA